MERACRNKKDAGRGPKAENKKDNAKFKKKRHVHKIKSQMEDSVSSEEELSAKINTVKVLSVDERSDGFWINAELEGHSVKMQIDTGSKASIVSFKTYKKCLMHLQLRPSDTVFRAYTGHPVEMKGMTDILVHCNSRSDTAVYVTRDNLTAIMGRTWLRKIRLDWQECKDKMWKWTENCQAAFQQAKDVLTTSQILTHFNWHCSLLVTRLRME